MKNKFYREVDILKDALYEGLVREKYFLVSPNKIRQYYFIAGIIVALASFFLLLVLFHSSPVRGIFAGILTTLPIFAFSRVMPAKTRKGASARMDILGFQEFMNRAEKDKLRRMGDNYP